MSEPLKRSIAPFRPASALREVLSGGYRLHDLVADLMAGCVVGIVALPLSMALAIASGVDPEHGLYTAIFAGGLTSLLGGSRFQITGPTAAFVVILAPISARFGPQGLAVATVMAGALLLVMGLARLGRLVEYIPYPVTTGFTAGIGVVIATLQLKDFLGLSLAPLSAEAHYLERLQALVAALPTVRWPDLAIGGLTLMILGQWRRLKSRIPAPLVAMSVAAVLAWWLGSRFEGLEVATLRSRFGTSEHPAGIPQILPRFVLPWMEAGPDGATSAPLTVGLLRALMPSAFAIAMLGAIESLLSAVVADGMTGQKHDPDVELFAQGVGNLVGPFFGGIAATGAIARTATNIRSQARSPISGFLHALFLLASILTLAPLLGHLPMAALAALLLMVAWNMSEARHFLRMVRTAPQSDVLVQLVCFSLTVLLDMTVAVTTGVVLAALLFMRRMADISGAKLVGTTPGVVSEPLPAGLVIYEIAGPLFFGAAQKATSQLHALARGGVKIVLMDLSAVPVMDATGLVNLQSAIDRLRGAGIRVMLAGVRRQPHAVLVRGGLVGGEKALATHATLHDGIAAARAEISSAVAHTSSAAGSNR